MSEFHKFLGDKEKFEWEDVERLQLTDKGLCSITKHILIGENEGAKNYIMRYFQVDAGGHSKLERHPQEHEVIILQGKGEVQIADITYTVEPFDALFIEGGKLHQFRAMSNESLGFICVIPKNP